MPVAEVTTGEPRRWRSITVGAVGGLLALVFVLSRLFVAADGDVSRFVVAGHAHTHAALVDPSIHVFETDGYDGQYSWARSAGPSPA